ncbi:hypothetical protein FACS1894113_1110 [Alphaproteobacteria bacterium]|nr:hypothetical protein FACS1894113_1110 [Alphaproteobacteria bacterium]
MPEINAKSLVINGFTDNSKFGISSQFALLLTSATKLNSEKLNETKYEISVFKKFEQQTNGIMINTYLSALAPNFIIEQKTSENITKGSRKIMPSFMERLRA